MSLASWRYGSDSSRPGGVSAHSHKMLLQEGKKALGGTQGLVFVSQQYVAIADIRAFRIYALPSTRNRVSNPNTYYIDLVVRLRSQS